MQSSVRNLQKSPNACKTPPSVFTLCLAFSRNHLASRAAPTNAATLRRSVIIRIVFSVIGTQTETKHTHVLEESKEFSCNMAVQKTSESPRLYDQSAVAWTGNFAMLRLVTRLPPLLLDPLRHRLRKPTSNSLPNLPTCVSGLSHNTCKPHRRKMHNTMTRP